MPNVSYRGLNMTDSPIRKLSIFTDQAKKRGKKVIHLNIGQPDIMPPADVLATIRQLDLSKIIYGASEGWHPLKKKHTAILSKKRYSD